MTIVYCTNTLWAGGGIEHVTIAKANALASIEGNVVWIIVTDNRFPPITPLDKKVRVIDLELKYYTDDHKRSRLANLFHLWGQRLLHKRVLKKALNKIDPDIIISTDSLDKYFLPYLRMNSNQVFLRVYHMWSHFHRCSPNSLYDKVLGWAGDFLNSIIIHKYDRIIVLTNEDKNRHWSDDEKVLVIPNPITNTHSSVSTLENKTVAAAGRLCRQKNFDLLIDSWTLVHRLHPEWQLEIWGDGPDRQKLCHKISQYNLEDSVFLKGYDSNLLSRLESSSLFVLSSIYEGFPLVILDAMTCGLPVIATSCPCGPRDLIIDGENGFLVPQDDMDIMAERICSLIDDYKLRVRMGENSLEKSNRYSMERIISHWMQLFEELIAEKRDKA